MERLSRFTITTNHTHARTHARSHHGERTSWQSDFFISTCFFFCSSSFSFNKLMIDYFQYRTLDWPGQSNHREGRGRFFKRILWKTNEFEGKTKWNCDTQKKCPFQSFDFNNSIQGGRRRKNCWKQTIVFGWERRRTSRPIEKISLDGQFPSDTETTPTPTPTRTRTRIQPAAASERKLDIATGLLWQQTAIRLFFGRRKKLCH